MSHAIGEPKSWYVLCPGCAKEKRRVPSHTTNYCMPCKSQMVRRKYRKDTQNIGKCLDCDTNISYYSFRCNPCDGVRARMNSVQVIHRRISNAARARVVSALRSQMTRKNSKTTKYLGCSIPELKKHLESKFRDGMSWDNYGFFGWHIDHIMPLASFDLTDENECLRAFNYINLQPLWMLDNIKKKNKIL